MTKPSDQDLERILDLLEGRLYAAAESALRAEIDASPRLRADLAWAQRFLTRSEAVVLEEPPQRLRGRLDALAAFLPERKPGVVERVIAAVLHDSWSDQVAAPAYRHSGAAQEHRQLLFGVGDVEVALDVYRQDDDLSEVFGHVLSEEASAPIAVRVIQPRTPAVESTAVELDVASTGEFQMTVPARDPLEIQINVGSHRLQVGPIRLADGTGETSP